MRINADFKATAMVLSDGQRWVRSPENGVERIMLDRIGNEVARATSIVRYAAGSSFERHEHALGEEFLVLDGVFSDEHGDYPTGTYVRNPPGSAHSPSSRNGCRILVKLRQFETTDLVPVVIDTTNPILWRDAQKQKLILHEFGSEKVIMRRLTRGADLSQDISPGGFELFVVSGLIEYDRKHLDTDSWLRLPAGADLRLYAREDAVLWIKSGHLPPTLLDD